MKRFLFSLIAMVVVTLPAPAQTHGQTDGQSEMTMIHDVLDSFHKAASDADFDTYFGHFHANGVFLGTDKTERWPVEDFKAFAKPIFDRGQGWTYVMTERHVDISPDGRTAFFDELLQNDAYGTSRGTGVLFLTDEGWKIGQYHLTFPMPNELAGEFTRRIKNFEAQELGPVE